MVLRLATRIIVPNRYTYDYVARIIGPRAAQKRCVLISWLSLPVPETSAKDDRDSRGRGVPAGRPVVPVIGFINRYKFSHVMFEMLEQGIFRDASGKTVTFCFAGDGPLRADGERRFAGREDVRFLRMAGQDNRAGAAAPRGRGGASRCPASSCWRPRASASRSSQARWNGTANWCDNGVSGFLVDPNRRAGLARRRSSG